MATPIHTPLPVQTHPNAPPLRDLTEQEQAEYDRVLAHFADPKYILPNVEAENGTLMEEERMWLSYECVLRYLRATKRDVSQTINRLEGTLKWRRDFGFYTSITAEHVEPEAVTGKMFILGHDVQGRPAIYYYLSRQNTEEGLRQLQFIFWIFERAAELMGPGVETVVVMVDYADKGQNPSISQALQIVNILQTHYPERLGAAIIAHLPWLLWAFWKIIMPFMDAVTRSKLNFDSVSDENGLWRSAEARKRGEDDAKLFEPDQLPVLSWEGLVPFTYAHEAYWPAFLSMCEERRNAMTRVWRELGGVVGIKEWDVKVGIRDGLAAPTMDGVVGQAS